MKPIRMLPDFFYLAPRTETLDAWVTLLAIIGCHSREIITGWVFSSGRSSKEASALVLLCAMLVPKEIRPEVIFWDPTTVPLIENALEHGIEMSVFLEDLYQEKLKCIN